MKKRKRNRALAIGAGIMVLALLMPLGWNGFRILWGKNQTASHTGEISFEEESSGTRSPQNLSGESSDESSISPEEREYLNWIQNKPDQDNVTVLLFGLDLDGLHTDVMMLCNFNTATKTTSLVSIPRDTQVTLTDQEYQALKDINRYTKKTLKLTEVHNYASDGGNANAWSVDMVEKLLDIHIDFYAAVTFEGFREVIDAIGGIEFDVPKTITTWNDDYQRNVTVEAGRQVLNGEQAEAVVRHRQTYQMGDLERVEMQQSFLRAAADQLLRGTLRLPKLIRTCSYVLTDAELVDILRYASIAADIDLDSLMTATLPGEARDEDGKSYFFLDKKGCQEMMAKIFNPLETPESLDSTGSDGASK
ncbi:MAG: LCP family protein [Bianqueaceae bacterium]